MMKLYSKEQPVSAIEAMKRTGRLAHAFLLTGERGVGKKFFADYIAMTLLCENGNACGQFSPCGECRHCKRILANTHPDVIKPVKSGKKQIYNRETIRNVCSDAFVSPNDCDAKVYIFSDCEGLEEGTQNLMLKLIEEPPDTVYFIFTAADRSVFLPTILSRVITLGIPECTEEDCLSALSDMGFPEDKACEAVKHCHGNIGNCLDRLEGGEFSENIELCKKITAAIADNNEYALLSALHQIGENRNRIKTVLEMTDKVVRDACMLRLGNVSMIGCDPDGAERLSRTISRRRAEKLHEAINDTVSKCALNMNVPIETAAFVCRVIA